MSLPASLGTFLHVHDAVVGLVEPAEAEGSVVHGPESIADLLEADDSMFEQAAHEDFALVPFDGAVTGDEPELVMAGILELGRAIDVGARRGPVDRGRRLEVQCFMRPFVVVDLPELVEAILLSPEVGRRR